MITLVSYIALRYFFGDDWSGFLLVLPLCLDWNIIARLEK